MDVTLLRAATAADHDAVESAVPLMHNGLTLPEYRAVLLRIHGVVAAWEQSSVRASEELALPWLAEGLRARSRLPFLESDLSVLGAREIPQIHPKMPRWNSAAEILGAMYVMEGSRLGGTLIAAHIAKVLPAALPATNFFRSGGVSTGAQWRQTLSWIGDKVPNEQAEGCIRSAKRMFKNFGDWMSGNSVENL